MENLIYNLVYRQKNYIYQQVKEKKYLRLQLKSLQASLSSPLVKVVTGPRRCGKSTLATLALEGLHFAYLNFEDDALPDDLAGDDILKALERVYGKTDIFFFDEIQNFPRWEQFIHRLHREGKNCLVTGSNAHLLSREMATALTGRHIAIELLPFSYKEFLDVKNDDSDENFLRFLVHGGFPEVIFQYAEPNAYLAALWDSIVLKDVVHRHRIRNSQGLNDLYNLVIHAIASRFNNDSLVRGLNGGISAPTVKKFLGHGNEAYLFTALERFHYGARQRMKFDRKAYAFDNGFIAAKRVPITADYGRFLENLVFIELVRRGYKPNLDLFYFVTESGYEVDFLLRQDGQNRELIQVTWSMQEQKTGERELRALMQAAKALKIDSLRIITFSQTEVMEQEGVKITVQSIKNWLME